MPVNKGLSKQSFQDSFAIDLVFSQGDAVKCSPAPPCFDVRGFNARLAQSQGARNETSLLARCKQARSPARR